MRGLLVFSLVITAGISLYLYVAVGARFEGRLWALPAEIYSDRMVLVPGESLSPAHVEQRLARNTDGECRDQGGMRARHPAGIQNPDQMQFPGFDIMNNHLECLSDKSAQQGSDADHMYH